MVSYMKLNDHNSVVEACWYILDKESVFFFKQWKIADDADNDDIQLVNY